MKRWIETANVSVRSRSSLGVIPADVAQGMPIAVETRRRDSRFAVVLRLSLRTVGGAGLPCLASMREFSTQPL